MNFHNVLVIGPNVNMTIHGGIVTHMKLLLSLSKLEKFYFKLQTFTLGKRKIVSEKITPYELFTDYLNYIGVLLVDKIEIVHINSSMKNGSIVKNFLVLLFAKIFFKKCIFQFHGGSPNDISNNFKIILQLIAYLSDKILVLTKEQSNIKIYLNKSEWKKIEQIPNFIEKREVKMYKRKYDSIIQFLFVGRIIREKGVYEIVEAANTLVKNNFSFHINIMGDGDDLNEMMKKVKKLQIMDYFTFHGFITKASKKDFLYATSHVMLFPSYKEGFPYAILEAMLFRLPIISSGVGALLDVIEDDINGFLIPSKNAEIIFEKMKYFIINSNEIKRMGLNSFELINSKYSTNIMKNKLSNIYNEIL